MASFAVKRQRKGRERDWVNPWTNAEDRDFALAKKGLLGWWGGPFGLRDSTGNANSTENGGSWSVDAHGEVQGDRWDDVGPWRQHAIPRADAWLRGAGLNCPWYQKSNPVGDRVVGGSQGYASVPRPLVDDPPYPIAHPDIYNSEGFDGYYVPPKHWALSTFGAQIPLQIIAEALPGAEGEDRAEFTYPWYGPFNPFASGHNPLTGEGGVSGSWCPIPIVSDYLGGVNGNGWALSYVPERALVGGETTIAQTHQSGGALMAPRKWFGEASTPHIVPPAYRLDLELALGGGTPFVVSGSVADPGGKVGALVDPLGTAGVAWQTYDPESGDYVWHTNEVSVGSYFGVGGGLDIGQWTCQGGLTSDFFTFVGKISEVEIRTGPLHLDNIGQVDLQYLY